MDGAGGKDTAVVNDRATAADVFEMGPGWVTMNGNSVPLTNIESCTVAATAGSKDTVRMYVAPNSQGKNAFSASPTSATMTMPGFTNTVLNAADVQAYTIPGGGDTATFTDSAGDDLLLASGIGAELSGKSGGNFFDVSAWGFNHFSGTSTGGSDEVRFYTLAGSKDSFVVSPTSATYTGGASSTTR